ncbi:MAG: SprT family zinc-dependent metalloprotease [Nitrospiraceae bacterium]|nr:SprT family zinc-dependent metalloprotease [Nitrospiraceae bacterium]
MWGSTRISYVYSYSKRKTRGLRVYPDLSVVVSTPFDTDIEKIRDFVRRRGEWIVKAQQQFDLHLPKLPPRQYISGETHRYLGRQYRLKIEQGLENSVKCLRGYLLITTKASPKATAAKALLVKWYRLHAATVFAERLRFCHAKAKRLGIPLPHVNIRLMVSRWGSFSLSGRITLNLALIKAPKECIDYVIMHELCHFKEKHHGPRFWGLMTQLMPDYKAKRDKLNYYVE